MVGLPFVRSMSAVSDSAAFAVKKPGLDLKDKVLAFTSQLTEQPSVSLGNEGLALTTEQPALGLEDEALALESQLTEIDRYNDANEGTPRGTRSDNRTAMLVFRDEVLERYNNISKPTTYQEDFPRRSNRLSLKCSVCLDRYLPHKTIHLKCADIYCTDCLKTLFLRATKDASLFPPKCCRQIIPLGLIQSTMSPEEQRAFEAAQLEFSTEDKKYCSNRNCQSLIPPSRIKAGEADCEACGTRTCVMCMNLAHGGDCPKDHALQAVLALARRSGWKRCYSCRTMVERNRGCNSMVCRCNAHFCYRCGKKYGSCRH